MCNKGFLVSLLLLGANCAPALAQEPSAAGTTPLVQWRVQQRSRYERLDDQVRLGFASTDQALALQTSLFIDAGRGRVRFSGEIMDVRTELNDASSFLNTTMVNALEPLQAYASMSFADALQPGSTSTLRAGRFTLDVGRRRFVSRSGFRNTVTSYSGFDWQWRGTDGRNARAFFVTPMRILPTSRPELLDNEIALDHANRDTRLLGLYYQFAPLPNRDRAEIFWYGLDQGDRAQNDANPRDFDSVGLRFFRPSMTARFSYEIETLWQQGRSSATAAGVTRRDLEHGGRFYHLELGYAFDARWSPVLLVQYDNASGDDDPFDARNDAFDTLFGERRFDFSPLGGYGIFARANLVTPGLRVTMSPAPRWQTMLSYRKFELETARDAWSGVGLRDLTGQAGRSIGRQLEGSFTWTAIPNRLTFETGFAQLWAGRFLRTTSAADFRGNPTFFYTVLTTTF